MSAATLLPQAIFGGLLWGDRAVRYVFIDEAGTSRSEPVTVVVGVVAHADNHLMLAEAAIREVLGAVPPAIQPGFVFHATDIWNSPKYRNVWAMSDRLGVLRAMMELPRRVGMAVTLGMVRRTTPVPKQSALLGLKPWQWQHVEAFNMCLYMADRYIRDYADLREVATVVAEDVPEMRRFLKSAPRLLRDNPMVFEPGALMPTEAETAAGYVTQRGDLRVTRIRSSVHFVDKQDDPMLQIADACAFGMRRFFSELEHGEMFVRAIVGGVPPLADFAGPGSGKIFFWHPGKN